MLLCEGCSPVKTTLINKASKIYINFTYQRIHVVFKFLSFISLNVRVRRRVFPSIDSLSKCQNN